ncbi:TonB-dependent receptor domain-containing protein [Pseudoalteromonas sp.]|uniref:TonB-dependent receptor domain-containing protein n=1 Tax=Pseudoalteromonas sp. TaxID=53249 RepID=UPI0035637020
MKRKPLAIAIYALMASYANHASANDSNKSDTKNAPSAETSSATQLETIVVEGEASGPSALAFGNTKKASDVIISREQLSMRSATLGNALSAELGIHSNAFGGGSSAPVIRGQDGVRVKILQNGIDVIDVSSMSPDHVITTDTLLAERVELVRGPSTLLYGTASSAGVVNVVDKRIPYKMPNGNFNDRVEGEALLRYNTNNQEALATAGATVKLTNNIALRVEGLSRDADNYKVPEFKSDVILNYLPDSYNKSQVGTIGLSWIEDTGYIGVAYSRRQDIYGIPGHNHNYDSCEGHLINWLGSSETGFHGRYYLNAYPHLMEDSDMIDFPHFDGCHVGGHADDHGHEHSHDQPHGFEHNHNHKGPWVDMTSDRYDVRGELKQPIQGIDKVKLSLTYADYQHDENDPGNPERNTGIGEGLDPRLDKGHAAAVFNNQGFNGRLEVYHTPVNGFSGMLGVQYQKQEMSATVPYLLSYGDTSQADPRFLLAPHSNKNLSVFGLEQYQVGDFTFEVAARWEKQKTPVKYDHELLNRKLEWLNTGFPALDSNKVEHPDLSPYKENAASYAGSIIWDFAPEYRVSLSVSHNERLPSSMELYYNGKHLATNSFEYGNKNLQKERSNNIELGISHSSENWEYNLSGYYNHFGNYIFNENITKFGDLYMRRYNQTTARFYGLEGDISYNITANQKLTVFGDFVRGKIGSLAPVVGKSLYGESSEVLGLKPSCQGLSGEQIADQLSNCVLLSNQQANPILEVDEACTANDLVNAAEYCVLSYPEKLGTDVLERPSTNAPRVPPARLGFRYHNYLTDKLSINMDYTRVFSQKKVTTSTIAIKPLEYDEDGTKRQYNNNSLLMQPRLVKENETQGYNLLNIGADYESTYGNIDYILSLRANNLLDEKVYIHNSFLPYVPQMGRSFTLGLNVKF